MMRLSSALPLLLTLSACPRSREAAPAPVALTDAGVAPARVQSPTPAPDAAARACSAAGLSAQLPPATPPLPPAVEATRQRIAEAAVRCDYAALGALAREGTQGFSFSFGSEKDPAAYWRTLEEVHHEPVLARMVKVLGLPYVQQHGHYAWPSAHGEKPSPADWEALASVYTPEQVKGFQQAGSYLGLRLAILPSGEWLYATSGD